MWESENWFGVRVWGFEWVWVWRGGEGEGEGEGGTQAMHGGNGR